MDHQPSGLSFAAIGHQDNWDKVQRFVNTIRDLGEMGDLSLAQIREVYRYIPPRPLFDVTMHSTRNGPTRGAYIETFISPDELTTSFLRPNLKKVHEACALASQLGIPVVSLGGFTSIVLESAGFQLEQVGRTFFTTGNTLTAAFIAKNVEKACGLVDVRLEDANLLVVGATGDIGSACARYFSGRVKELLLCARQAGNLPKQATLLAKDSSIRWSTDINDLLPHADVIICVASSFLHGYNWNLVRKEAIVCDAGYPKNLDHVLSTGRLFYGGMGEVENGFSFSPDYQDEIYGFPVERVVHGCLLEAIVLSMEREPQAFSQGRGNITVDRMERILQMAATHGIRPSPLFNQLGRWHHDTKIQKHVYNH